MERELAALEGAGAEAVASAGLRRRCANEFEARDGYTSTCAWTRPSPGSASPGTSGRRRRASCPAASRRARRSHGSLVADPDLLLLDEPTNHLDVAAIEWLEEALARATERCSSPRTTAPSWTRSRRAIWELRDRRLDAFRGGYSAYLLQREAADARARQGRRDRRTDAIARERELVQRYRSHRKFAKMHEHERRLEALEERRVEAPRRAPELALRPADWSAAAPTRSGDMVVGLR